MGEVIVSAITLVIVEKIVSLLQCSLAFGVEKELTKLKNVLSEINYVLLDAEKQQLKDEAVRSWLGKLKEVAYDADDVVDIVSTEALRQQEEIHGSLLRKVSDLLSPTNPLAFRFEIGRKIKEIGERLGVIAEKGRCFRLTSHSVDMGYQYGYRDRLTTSRDEFVFVGREQEKRDILELVFAPSSSYDESLSVISIVGFGGSGKTTLARLVYNDDPVRSHFDLQMWVCVTENFDLKGLVKDIIRSATNANCGDIESLEGLQIRLRDTLNAKKFLLVLDDVSHVDYERWADLRNFLIRCGGASGSKIIVTTRSSTVAKIMGPISPVMLGGLSNDHCLSILMRLAFGDWHEGKYPELEEIGKGIVEKCGGHPLAARTFGRLLYMKTDMREWFNIRDSDIWTFNQEYGFLRYLRVSYQLLPSYLKPCFAYCSIFPKTYEIGRVSLINHWMAQGFLHSPNESLELEDIGNQYFMELMSTELFQPASETFDSEIYKCKMHDFAHDLAQQVASTEWSEVGFKLKRISQGVKRISQGVRHVSFIGYDYSDREFPTYLFGAEKLRSFRFSLEVGPIKKSFVETLILRFRCLRVLDLTDSQFEELPSFVSKLKHLRFLRLSWNRSLKTLPNSICKLLNLQSLYLFDCVQLQDLPRDIGKLVSLRHLYLTSKLSCMPQEGLKGLTSLRSLILSRCENLESLSDGIQNLTSLRTLRISECPQLASLPSGMKYLIALEKLEIWDCQELTLLESEDLQGLNNLRSLAIRGLPKLVALPQGLLQSTLQYLLIQNCQALTSLSGCLEDLRCLQRLHITNCTNLTSLPDGVRRLTALSIKGCPHLSRTCEREIGEDWPKIAHILDIDLDSVKIK